MVLTLDVLQGTKKFGQGDAKTYLIPYDSLWNSTIITRLFLGRRWGSSSASWPWKSKKSFGLKAAARHIKTKARLLPLLDRSFEICQCKQRSNKLVWLCVCFVCPSFLPAWIGKQKPKSKVGSRKWVVTLQSRSLVPFSFKFVLTLLALANFKWSIKQ